LKLARWRCKGSIGKAIQYWVTNGLELEEPSKNLADLYFRRWPIQENFFIELNKELPVREAKAKEIKIEKEEVSRELVQCRKTLDTLITNGLRDGKELGNAAARHQLTLAHYEAVDIKDRKAEKNYTERRAQQEKSNASLIEIKEKKEKLIPLKTIRKIDVELDKILTATKLTFSLLITFVLREYLLVHRYHHKHFFRAYYALREDAKSQRMIM
jgi:adenylate kinase family enzyme